jgi:hypothetical protein
VPKMCEDLRLIPEAMWSTSNTDKGAPHLTWFLMERFELMFNFPIMLVL